MTWVDRIDSTTSTRMRAFVTRRSRRRPRQVETPLLFVRGDAP